MYLYVIRVSNVWDKMRKMNPRITQIGQLKGQINLHQDPEQDSWDLEQDSSRTRSLSTRTWDQNTLHQNLGQNLGPDHSLLGPGIGPGTRSLFTRTWDRTWDQNTLYQDLGQDLGPDHSPLEPGIGPGTRTLSTRTWDMTWDHNTIYQDLGQDLGTEHSLLGPGIGPGTRTLSTRTWDRTWDQITLYQDLGQDTGPDLINNENEAREAEGTHLL